MIRKLALAALIATGTAGGLTSTASAQPPAASDRHDRDRDRDRGRFEVLERHHGHWDSVGVFRDRDDAQRAARQIERRGGDAQVRRLDGGRR